MAEREPTIIIKKIKKGGGWARWRRLEDRLR